MKQKEKGFVREIGKEEGFEVCLALDTFDSATSTCRSSWVREVTNRFSMEKSARKAKQLSSEGENTTKSTNICSYENKKFKKQQVVTN